MGMLMSGGGNWAEKTRISFSSTTPDPSSSPDFFRPKSRLRREFFLSSFRPWMPSTSGSLFPPLPPSLSTPSLFASKSLLSLTAPLLPLSSLKECLSFSKSLLACWSESLSEPPLSPPSLLPSLLFPRRLWLLPSRQWWERRESATREGEENGAEVEEVGIEIKGGGALGE